MELKLRIGIDNLVFGMSQSDIEEILGRPDKEFIHEDDPNQIIWEFNERKLTLTFYADEDSRFGYLRSQDKELTLNGRKLLESKIEPIVDGLEFEVEDYGFFRIYFDEKNWLSFREEYGVVCEVELGVPFKNDEEYDWPK